MTRRGVRFGALLAAFLGLGAVAGAAALLVWTRPRTVDGNALLAETFDLGALPFGLRVASATRTPTGETAIVLEPEVLEDEPPAAAPSELVDGSGEADEEQESPREKGAEKPFDWSKIPIGESGKPPRQVVVVLLPEATASMELRRLFRQLEWKELSDLGERGGLSPISDESIDWGGYDAPCVHLRSYEPGGTFRDSIRVNLSAAGERCALHAIWTRGLPASRERVEELLRALAPKVKPRPRGA